ncbi:stress protein [Paenibacillus sp. S3N08]|uniref:Stress protein n=1 Tax=Paenibacillus agricola TaxID=2716264 RepID=A0ABX0JBH9_9BACL|nr:stress protein [Paenibacillus agricola]
MNVLKGQKIDVTKNKSITDIDVFLGWSSANKEISLDSAAFLLSEQDRCEKEENFIFYGNPFSPGAAVSHSTIKQADNEKITISLPKLQPDIKKIAFTLTIYEGEKLGHQFGQVMNMYLRIVDRSLNQELLRYEFGADLSRETAIVVAELYLYKGEWRFNAIGSGFFGGLAALCKNYGLDVEEEPPHSNEDSLLSRRKKIVQAAFEKKKLHGVIARVGLVLDISGSMRSLYQNGAVQEVVDRILAVASKFDDNQTLDVWIYDNEFSRLLSVKENEIENYVQKHILNNDTIHKFGRNNEPLVMEDVIRKYTKEEPSEHPAFIVFINDGGVVKPTKKVIIDASVLPIFWQFIGIGNSEFELLQKLDEMEGRFVDNANFFHLNDISDISDELLYDELLNEFPEWLQAAKAKGIISI